MIMSDKSAGIGRPYADPWQRTGALYEYQTQKEICISHAQGKMSDAAPATPNSGAAEPDVRQKYRPPRTVALNRRREMEPWAGSASDISDKPRQNCQKRELFRTSTLPASCRSDVSDGFLSEMSDIDQPTACLTTPPHHLNKGAIREIQTPR
jgi:hypothetical protein